MKKFGCQGLENLEKRLFLTASASVTDGGDLIVAGDADGAIEIAAVDEGTFAVSDDGVLLGTFDGVSDDIRIMLGGEEDGANDDVTINLGEQAVDKIFAALGGGDNTFSLSGGFATGVHYRGGNGADNVQIDSSLEGRISANLGHGDNNLDVAGNLGGLRVRGGDGNDSLSIGETARITGSVRAALGGGDNTVSHAGTIDQDLIVRTKNENDTVDVADTATVGGETDIGLGEQMDRAFVGRRGRGHGRMC